MLVRRIARPLLAAPFIYGGISTLRKPQDRVPGATPVVEKLAETADKQLPVQVPRDVEQWVKADAAIKVAAGSLFALNKFPRVTALVLSASIVPTTLAGHRFWEHDDPTEQFGQISNFLKNTGILGGLLLAAVDTEGRPSVGYRARRAAKRAADVTEKNYEKASKRAIKAQKKASRKTGKKTGKGALKVLS
ncbi:DoxX family protein [Blastococcus xanthinilyticus]|uniref:Putative membrane protein YphA (DoxX/SURF4 family) n=1 Tax=Blastococcus xanthinilyticus TaxID=1564164 RepID=A0A5S5CVQ5_9ACTN|nr:DoxX family protein [Blastococcus xanthinilyticus]TYP87174.1 putative membrane protein YphA (DoxX/SURF4 family) [Blastococcus xanthinilyticus]